MIIIIFYIVVIILSLISIFSFIFFWIKYKKNKIIYKSIFSSLFKSFTSIFIIIIFYSVTFSLVGAFNSYSAKVTNALNTAIIDNHSHQVDFSAGQLNETNDKTDYNKLFYYSIKNLDVDSTPYVITSGKLKDQNSLISEYDNFFYVEYGISDFWEIYGFKNFGKLENFISELLYWNAFTDYNNAVANGEYVDIPTNSELVYNIYSYYLYQPINSNSSNEAYYLMSYNDLTFPKFSENMFRYSGKNNDYVLDNIIFEEIYGNYTEQDVRDILSAQGDEYNENGTKEAPFKVVVQKEYVESNNYNLGETIQIGEYYFQIIATASFSNILYPIYSFSNFITDYNEQAAIMMNFQSLSQISRGRQSFTYNFGFTDIYDDANNAFYYTNVIYNASMELNDQKSILHLREEAIKDEVLNQTKFNRNNEMFIFGDCGIITGEKTTLESYRISNAVSEISQETIILNIFMYIFLAIIIFVLILLIQKRVKDYSKQFGTLKALGLNRNESSIAFLVYPMFIIGVAGFIALLLSIPIQLFFFMAYTSFFSIPTTSFVFSFGAIFYVILFPALILFAISVIISNNILRKPTIDLLSNKINDEPNVIVVASGKLVPTTASFSFAYKYKGLTRAWGKSLLLIASIFLATSLTALSLAARGAVDDVKTITTNNINYDYVSVSDETNYEYNYYDINSTNYSDSLSPLYPDVLFTSIYNLSQIRNYFVNTNSVQMYEQLGNWVLGPSNEKLNIEIVSENKANYYIPKEALLNYYVFTEMINYKSNLETSQNFNFDIEWNDSGYSQSDFNSITSFFKLANQYLLINSKWQDKNINDLIAYIDNLSEDNYKNAIENFKTILNYSPDLVFRDVYYNSDYQTIGAGAFLQVQKNKNFFSSSYDSYRLNIFSEPQYINNIYTIPQSSIDKLNDEVQIVEETGTISYIPVIVDSFTFNFIRLQYPTLFVPTGIGEYEATLYYSDFDNGISHQEVTVKVVDVYPTYFAIGFTTTEALITNYNWPPDVNFTKVYYHTIYWSQIPYTSNNSLTLTLLNQYTNTTNGSTVTFQEYINNSKLMNSAPLSKQNVFDQTEILFTILNSFLLVISIFALIVALILSVIAMKDVNDKSKKEVGMLKALGYSTKDATSLVLTPYAIIILVGFIFSIPFALLTLFLISSLLTNLTGSTFKFALSLLQWVYIIIFIILLIALLTMISYNFFKRTKALDVLSDRE